MGRREAGKLQAGISISWRENAVRLEREHAKHSGELTMPCNS